MDASMTTVWVIEGNAAAASGTSHGQGMTKPFHLLWQKMGAPFRPM
ncbi:MAG: hypothetical protein OXG51_14285 [Gammaproteobacteria bacterium]|nr:hypothetical protein [Gammaproteobacteria bacterium]